MYNIKLNKKKKKFNKINRRFSKYFVFALISVVIFILIMSNYYHLHIDITNNNIYGLIYSKFNLFFRSYSNYEFLPDIGALKVDHNNNNSINDNNTVVKNNNNQIIHIRAENINDNKNSNIIEIENRKNNKNKRNKNNINKIVETYSSDSPKYKELKYLTVSIVQDALRKHPFKLISNDMKNKFTMIDYIQHLHKQDECKDLPIFTSMANVYSDLYWQL